ncbi:MAG TPA: hypothetical protein VFM55_03550 [Micromonosporaceae bacterium]|nr:hypothetical protein [Micromonosporaceae bacterium]
MAEQLTIQERETIKTAAYGAVTLVSIAYPGAISSTKVNVVGAKVLTGATGLVGEVLAGKDKVHIEGRSTAEIAATVLPALSKAVGVLQAKAPDEVDGFRRIVMIALDQSTGSHPNPAQAEMISKVKGALYNGSTG